MDIYKFQQEIYRRGFEDGVKSSNMLNKESVDMYLEGYRRGQDSTSEFYDWIVENDSLYCGRCNALAITQSNFCPVCGARMHTKNHKFL